MRLGGEDLSAAAATRLAATHPGGNTATWAGTPARFSPTFSVQAIGVGNDPAAVVEWIQQVSLDPFARTQVLSNHVVEVAEHGCGSRRQTLVRCGDVLVQQPGSRFGWDVYTAAAFRTAYVVRPRELPIFNDGEVA